MRIPLPSSDAPPEKLYSMADPEDPETLEALHTARYAPERLTRSQMYRILALAEEYQHLACYELGVEHCIQQLRELRRALQARRTHEPTNP